MNGYSFRKVSTAKDYHGEEKAILNAPFFNHRCALVFNIHAA